MLTKVLGIWDANLGLAGFHPQTWVLVNTPSTESVANQFRSEPCEIDWLSETDFDTC